MNSLHSKTIVLEVCFECSPDGSTIIIRWNIH